MAVYAIRTLFYCVWIVHLRFVVTCITCRKIEESNMLRTCNNNEKIKFYVMTCICPGRGRNIEKNKQINSLEIIQASINY